MFAAEWRGGTENFSFTLGKDWISHPLQVRIYHWKPVPLFTGDTEKYSEFDSYGIPYLAANGAKVSEKIRL